MSQLIVFVRHGESGANVKHILSDHKDKYPLTPDGISHAKRAAKELRKLRFEALFSSPVLRARQTAAIIGKEISLPVSIDKRLWERRMGRLNGKDSGNGQYKFLNGSVKYESTESVYRRTLDFMDSRDESSFVAVAHMVQQESIAYAIFGLDDFTGFPFRPTYASMTLFEKTGRRIKVLASGFPELPDAVLRRVPKRFLM